MRAAARTRLRRLAAAAFGALAAAGVAPAAGETGLRPAVEREGPGRLRISWPEDFATGPVAVYGGSDPAALRRDAPLATASGGSVALEAPQRVGRLGLARRLYFELVPLNGGPTAVVAERRLPLEGADNFRDLGGYRSADGRRVRWGRLYRSNDLSKLTRHDLAYLSASGLRLVCDLRSEPEREHEPDRLAEPMRSIELPVAQQGVDASTMRDQILSGGIAALGIERTMRRAYAAFVTDPGHTEQWRRLLARLADPAAEPTLVHCTAGKDRTGFAAAVVLLALGVPRETVFEDYLLTNRYRADFARFVTRWAPLASFFRTSGEDVLPLLEARRAYLETSLAAMREGWGSVEEYLEQALGLDAELRDALARNLLRAP